jgi:hypothetical protein
MSNDTIQLNFKADTFEEAISQAIAAALGSGMSPREIIAQLIARDFLRDPGNNALEDVVRGLADLADRLRHDPTTPAGQAAQPRSEC